MANQANSVNRIRVASARRFSAPCAAATAGPTPTPARPTVTPARFDAEEGARAPEGHRAGHPVPATAVAEGSPSTLKVLKLREFELFKIENT